jgi:para-nitrobenzyl esterase
MTKPASPGLIHGGAFINGFRRNPPMTARSTCRATVVVTANYRLGALGFLYLEDMDSEFAESGTWGCLTRSQLSGGKRTSIGSGRPRNVTIIGPIGWQHQSILMAAPEAKGLSKELIAESGAPNSATQRECCLVAPSS